MAEIKDKLVSVESLVGFIREKIINLIQENKASIEINNITNETQQAQIDLLLGKANSSITSAVYFNTYEIYTDSTEPENGKYYLLEGTSNPIMTKYQVRGELGAFRTVNGHFLNPNEQNNSTNTYYISEKGNVTLVQAANISDAVNYIDLSTKHIYAYNSAEGIFTDITEEASVLPIWDLNVYQQEITVGAKTGVENIFISTNTDWSIQCDADWIYLSHIFGTNCAMIQVRYDYNETGQDRTATITVSANGQQNGITFNQLKVLPTSVSLSADGEVRLTTDNNMRV